MDVFASKPSEETALEQHPRRGALCLAGQMPQVGLVGGPAGPASCGLRPHGDRTLQKGRTQRVDLDLQNNKTPGVFTSLYNIC